MNHLTNRRRSDGTPLDGRHGISELCDGSSWRCITKHDRLSWFGLTRFRPTIRVSKQEQVMLKWFAYLSSLSLGWFLSNLITIYFSSCSHRSWNQWRSWRNAGSICQRFLHSAVWSLETVASCPRSMVVHPCLEIPPLFLLQEFCIHSLPSVVCLLLWFFSSGRSYFLLLHCFNQFILKYFWTWHNHYKNT